MKYFLNFLTIALCLCITLIPLNLIASGITFSGIVSEKATSLPMDSVEIKIINSTDPAVYYFTKSNSAGIWSFTIPVSSFDEVNSLPENFTLEQNFPNPFNPSTRILFSTGASGNVRLSMYNITGELIDRLNLSLNSGNYSVDWSSKGAAGILFYSLEFEGKRITKKMVQLDGGGNGGFSNVTNYGLQSGNRSISKTIDSDYLVIASKLIYMPDTLTIPFGNNTEVNFSLRTVHDAVFVFDLHNDVMEKVVNGYNIGIRNANNQSDLPRFKEGGMDAQMFAIWVSPGDTVGHTHYSYSMEMIDSFDVQVNRFSDRLIKALTYNEIIAGAETGKLVGVLGLEGGHSIANDPEKLKNFYNRGVRYLTITWNNSTSWAVSGQDSRSATVGLSDFGRQIIRLMDSLGIIIDVAHTGIKTISDILEITKNPIVDTHCGARKLRNHYRNLYDYQIDSIAARGGVIGVVFYPSFLSSSNSTNIDTVIKHIDYIKNRVGIEHVAIGSDYDGIESTPLGLEDVSKLPKLTAALIRKGYTIADIRKLMGENYLRVYKHVCK